MNNLSVSPIFIEVHHYRTGHCEMVNAALITHMRRWPEETITEDYETAHFHVHVTANRVYTVPAYTSIEYVGGGRCSVQEPPEEVARLTAEAMERRERVGA